METISEIGHWGVVLLMIGIASAFLLGFVPLSKRNWRQLGITEAFIVALYTEMYGFSLTIYFLSAILGRKIPFTHISGHLWATLFGWGETGAFWEMLIGWAITFIGIGLIVAGWKRIHEAKPKDLVTSGVYAFIRHPQYTGIILATFGTLIHWPTLFTFFLWPILIFAYWRLAKKEEKEMIKKYGTRYRQYQKKVSMFVPSLSLILRFLKDKKRKTPQVRRSKKPDGEYPQPVLKKVKQNPILKPIAENSWESKLVFNPAAVHEGEKVHLVYRAVGDKNVSVLGYASSKDGIHIDERLKDPIYVPRESFESNHQAPKVSFVAYMSGGGCGGCEDPRMTKVNDKFYMTYTAFNGVDLPRMALTSIEVKDFLRKRWRWRKPVLISPPNEIHKNWVIFPEKINGKYAILHSISPDILVDYFDSLELDGTTYIRSCHGCGMRKNCWDNKMRGVGPPPIKTRDGWMILYHAMDSRDPNKYKIGAMLLDQNDPTKILYRSAEPILEPDAGYENNGFKAGVVYTCGAVIVKDRLFVYYGGADTVVCVAIAPLDQFLEQLRHSEETKLEPMYDYY